MGRRWVKTVVILGVIALLGDIIYEGARSVMGPYLEGLGVNAVELGLIVGLAEMLGYMSRLPSGYLADTYGLYVPLMIIGYLLTISVPLMGFFNDWRVLAVLIALERMGKGIRGPAKDAYISFAAEEEKGLGFGIHEALDQFGAIIGPLSFSAILALGFGYRVCFLATFIPFALLTILLTKIPRDVEVRVKREREGLGRLSIFIFLTTLGFVNFQLISYHFKAEGISDYLIPLAYAAVMASDAVMAPVLGRIYDMIGLRSLLLIPILTSLIPLSFLNPLAVIFYGVALCSYETILKSAVAEFSSSRGKAYGITNVIYGLSAFIGSLAAGYIYTISPDVIPIFVIFIEIPAILIGYLISK